VSSSGVTWINKSSGTQHTFSFSGEGSYKAYVRAWNLAGVDNTVNVSFLIDLTPPTINITSPSEGETILAAIATIHMQCDDSDLDHYELSVDGGTWLTASNPYDLEHLDDGLHSVRARAYDHAGNFGQDQVTFDIDLPPDLTITFPTDRINVLDVNVTWFSSAEDILRYEVSKDSSSWTDVDLLTYHNMSFPGEGTYEVFVRAYDIPGNIVTKNLTFVIDTTLPDITITAPDNEDIFNTASVVVSWFSTAEDIDRYEVSVDGIEWDDMATHNSTTVTAPEGIMTIHVAAVDTAGNRDQTTVDVIIDLTVPTLVITYPAHDSRINVTDVPVQWDAYDINGIADNLVSTNGIDWFSVGTNSTHTLTMDEGQHTIWIAVVDNAGNRRQDTTTFTIDVTLPIVTFLSPSENAILNASSFLVSWEANEDMDHYEITAATSWRNIGQATSHHLNVSEGDATIRLKAYDLAGNQVIIPLNITIDLTPPSIEITNPPDGGFVGTIDFEAQWSATDTNGIRGYEYSIDGQNFTWTTSQTAILQLTVGPHSLVVRAYDSANNSALASSNFDVDFAPPSITIISPENDSAVCSTEFLVEWIGNDTGGISRYEISTFLEDWIDMGLETSTMVNLNEGTHIIKVRAYDLAGNTNMDHAIVTVDLIAPDISILSPVDGTMIPTTSPEVRWHSTADDIDHYAISVDGDTWSNLTATSETIVLGQGEYTVLVKAIDRAGNENITSSTFTVDTIPPDLVLLRPGNNTIFPFIPVPVEWYSTAEDLDSYGLLVDDIPRDVETNITSLSLAAGIHNITILAYDHAGNENSTTVTISIDAAPILTIVSPTENIVNGTEVTFRWECDEDDVVFEVHENQEWIVVGGNSRVMEPVEGENLLQVRATDTAGNVVQENVTVIRDTIAPTILTRSPTGISVPEESIINITFSEEMSSVSIVVTDMTGTTDLNLDTVTFVPSQYLVQATIYLVEVQGEDLAGNHLAGNWSFTVEGTVSVTGRCVDGDSLPLEGIIVTAGGETDTTDQDGRYHLDLLPGEFTITATDGERNATMNITAQGPSVFVPDIVLYLEQEMGDLYILLIALGAMVVVAGATLLVFFRRR
jgi:hypothetical protein